MDAPSPLARAADDGRWSRLNPGDRKRILIRWADLIEANAPRARPDRDPRRRQADHATRVGLDMPETATCIRWHAEADRQALRPGRARRPRARVATITREPVRRRRRGHPLELPGPDGGLEARARRSRPATRVVIKPASTTSLSLLRIAELGAEAGLPDGVLNVVTGPGRRRRRGDRPPPGRRLPSPSPARPRSAAGSSTTPPRSNLKRVLLELGGKSPQLVFADATGPRRRSPRTSPIAIFWNMGENCSAGSRLHRPPLGEGPRSSRRVDGRARELAGRRPARSRRRGSAR